MSKYKPPKTHGWQETHADLARSFYAWGVVEWTAEPNVPLARVNSMSLSKVERSVTVRFMKGAREVVLSMDRYDSATANLKVIALCIDDMRMIERRGLSETMQSAYMQLAAPPSERDPWDVLGLQRGASSAEIDAMYRVKAKAAHPDAGGSEEAMAALNKARERLLAEVAA